MDALWSFWEQIRSVGAMISSAVAMLWEMLADERYVCAEHHRHKTEEGRNACNANIRDRRDKDHEVTMAFLNHKKSREDKTFCMKMIVYIFALLIVLLIVSAAIAIGILCGKGILKFR